VHLGLRAATGLGLSLTGWGLILVGLSLVGEVLAVVLTPSEQQAFLRRTYFGIGPNKFKTLEEELQALEALGRETGPPEAPGPQPASTSPGGPRP
jgi:hypothetical protein